jgi:Ca2+-transporting ATPase
MGIVIAVATIVVESIYEAEGAAVAATMGFVVFSLFNIVLGPMSRSETETVFARDTISSSRQLMLVGLAFLFTVLPTQLGFLQRWLGLTELTGNQWLVALGIGLGLLLLDEVVKLVLRGRTSDIEVSSPARPAVTA